MLVKLKPLLIVAALLFYVFFSTVSTLWNVIALFSLTIPLMLIWWHLAISQTSNYPTYFKPKHFYKKHYNCSYDWPRNSSFAHEGGSEVAVVVMVSPHKQKCDQKSNTKFKAYESSVNSHLLMLAGDVESNPGPGT